MAIFEHHMSGQLRKIASEIILDSRLRELAGAASSALLIRSVGTLLGFLTSVIIARLIGTEGAGVYYLAVSVMIIAASIGNLGFENTVVRFVASHASAGEWNSVRFVCRNVLRIVSISSSIVAIFLFVGASWIANNVFDKQIMVVPLMLMALSVVPFSLAMIQAEVLRGLMKIPSSQLIKTALISFGIVVLIYPFAIVWNTNGPSAAYFVATLIVAVIAWVMKSRALRNCTGEDISNQSVISIGRLFQSSWPLYGVVLTGLLVQQAATVLLGIWGAVDDVGIFNVANKVASLMLFPLFAITSVLAPKCATLHRMGAKEELSLLARRSSLMLMFFALPAAGVVFVFAEQILAIFGQGFVDGTPILRILMLGVVANTATGSAPVLLMMTGHEKSCRDMNMIAGLVVFVLCFLLIPSMGGIGAAIAVTLGITAKSVLMVVTTKVKLGFWPVLAFKGTF